MTDAEVQTTINEMVHSNPGQGSAREYEYIYETIRRRAPANVLSFGVGRDSGLWCEANPGGRTVFLESDPDWIVRVQESTPGLEIHQVGYRTRRWQWPYLYVLSSRAVMNDLADFIWETDWDVIIVDGPVGNGTRTPGRMASIITAGRLKLARDSRIFVHDVDRAVERRFAARFLPGANLLPEFDRLACHRPSQD